MPSSSGTNDPAKTLELNYWLGSVAAALACWLGWEYARILDLASPVENLVFYLTQTFGFLSVILSWTALSACLPARGKRILTSSGGMALGFCAALLWLDARLFILMKVHLSQAFQMLWGESFYLFRLNLSALGLTSREWISFTSLPLAGMAVGYLLSRITIRLSALAPMMVRRRTLLFCLIICSCGFVASRAFAKTHGRHEILSLAASASIFEPDRSPEEAGYLRFPFNLKPAPPIPLANPPEWSDTSQARPANIFIFVVECLRADVLQREIAPNLVALQEDSLPVSKAISSGNATHLGWFSLLTANSSLRVRSSRLKTETHGSTPFKILKKLGFHTTAITSRPLDFFDMDRLAFGDQLELADKVLTFGAHPPPGENGGNVAIYDTEVTAALLQNLPSKAYEKSCLISFYNSTHSPYFFPRNSDVLYPDFLDEWDYQTISRSPQEVARVKRKYLNAVHFVDHEIGRAIQELKSRGLYENSVIVVIGDHGEEFMEEGHMFHSNEPSRHQTEITFLMKLPGKSGIGKEPRLACSMDVFPTIFDSFGIYPWIKPFSEGRSLLTDPQTVVLSAAAVGFRDSDRFILNTANLKTYFRFTPLGAPIWSRNHVWLERVVGANEEPVNLDPLGGPRKVIETLFAPAAIRTINLF